MGLMRSLYAGVSGLRNHQVMMDVLGNNISNVNTVGFKTGRVSFSETFAQTLRGTTQPIADMGGSNPMQVGLGMSLASIDTLFGQGNIESTGQTTDLALQGDAFFVVSDGATRQYTRAGNFQLNANGTMVMPGNGAKVQGFMANLDGEIEAGTGITDLTIPLSRKLAARATSNVSLAGNLDAEAKPQGNILKTADVFAIEDGSSDIDGLLATGTAGKKITSLASGTTDVKVNVDGVEKSYKYVLTDSGTGNTSFHNLNDLIAEIKLDFNAAGLDANMAADGSIQFTNTSGAAISVDVNSSHPVLREALNTLSSASLAAAGTTSSDAFSHVAKSTDLLTSLRNENGVSLGLTAGDEVTINGLVGETAVTPHTFSVGAASTYSDYASEIETAFGLTNVKGVEISAEDGALLINADGGKIYELSALDIRADDTAGAGGTDRTLFNGIFDSSPNHYDERQEAKDIKQSASITVYDSLGAAFDLTAIFTKDVTSPNSWKWEIEVPEPAVATGGSTGYVEFNDDGSLKSFVFDDGSSSLQLDPGKGVDDLLSINLAPGDFGGFDGITQLAGPSTSVLINSQDGHGMGNLERISIDELGKITGSFNKRRGSGSGPVGAGQLQ